jgi:hypothetical protein
MDKKKMIFMILVALLTLGMGRQIIAFEYDVAIQFVKWVLK